MKMRIGFDRQTFTIQKYGGISRYFSDLYLGLLKQPGIEADLLFRRHQNAYLGEQGIGMRLHPFAAKCYMKAMVNYKLHIPISSSEDIHHSTYYLGLPQKTDGHTKLVSTLYDMTPELFPQFFKINPHFNKLEWFKASDLIISISDSAAADLTFFHPALANRIRRIHLYSGFDAESPQTKPKAIRQEDNPYMLFVGERRSYKNGTMLVRAFAASEPKRHGYKLVFAGGGAFSQEEHADIDRLGITSNVQQMEANDRELWFLYRHAKAVLVPSMAEGFSLPLVEGLIADVPVICSDIPVHREIAGDFAELINTLQYQDWAETLKTIPKQKRPSQRLGLKAYCDKCQYFSKERMVKQHVETYREILRS
jgi:glycosyltransferase involved in cell wall biosynthesis